jgi:hypothetical protein
MAKITTIPLFCRDLIGTSGTAGTNISGVVDMRDVDAVIGKYSLSYGFTGTAGALGSAGTTTFEYLGSPTEAGTFVTLGTFGTYGVAAQGPGVMAFTPTLVPFMKIRAISGTCNTAYITAELNVQ